MAGEIPQSDPWDRAMSQQPQRPGGSDQPESQESELPQLTVEEMAAILRNAQLQKLEQQ